MKQRTLRASLSFLTYFGSALCHLTTNVELGPIKTDDTIHRSLAGKNDLRIQDSFWDTIHDDSWKSLTSTAHLRATSTKKKMTDCAPDHPDCGLEALLSMVDDINMVFIPNAAPEHRHILEDLKIQHAKHAYEVWREYGPYEGTRIVDETIQHILKSALAFKIFHDQIYLRNKASQGQSHVQLSTAFVTSRLALTYAEGFQASIGFLNMVEHLVMDGLKEERFFRRFSLRPRASIPSERRLTDNRITSRIMHHDSVLKWWKCWLSNRNPYFSRSEKTAEEIKKKLQKLDFIGTPKHIDIWKRLDGVGETSHLFKKNNQDTRSLLEIYPTAKNFFERLMENDCRHELEILGELYKIMEIFHSCHDHRDERTLNFAQEIIAKLFNFDEKNLASLKQTVVQRAKYMVMWWVLSQSAAKTILKLGQDHGSDFRGFDYSDVLRYVKYLWHFMDENQTFMNGLGYTNRQKRSSFVLGRNYFIYIGCQLHLQDLITQEPSHLWPRSGNSVGRNSLESIISLDNNITSGVRKDMHNSFSEYMRNFAQTPKHNIHKEPKSSTGIVIQDKQRVSEKRRFSGTYHENILELPRSKIPRVESPNVPDDDTEEGEIVYRMDHNNPGDPSGFDNSLSSDFPARNEGSKRNEVEYTSSGQSKVHGSPSQEIKVWGQGNKRYRSGMEIIAQKKQRIPQRTNLVTKEEKAQLESPTAFPIFPGRDIDNDDIVAEKDHSKLKSHDRLRNVLPVAFPTKNEKKIKSINTKKGKNILSDQREVLGSHYPEMNNKRQDISQKGGLEFDGSNHKAMRVKTKNMDDMMLSPKSRDNFVSSSPIPPQLHHLITTPQKKDSPHWDVKKFLQGLFGEETPKGTSSPKNLQEDIEISNMQPSDTSDAWSEIRGIEENVYISPVKDYSSMTAAKFKQHFTLTGGIQKIMEKEKNQIQLPESKPNNIASTKVSLEDTPTINPTPQSFSSMIWNSKGKGLKVEIPPRHILSTTHPKSSHADNLMNGVETTQGHLIKPSPFDMFSSSSQVQNQFNFLKTLHSGEDIGKSKHNHLEEGTSMLPEAMTIENTPPNPPSTNVHTVRDQVIPRGFRLFGVNIKPTDHHN